MKTILKNFRKIIKILEGKKETTKSFGQKSLSSKFKHGIKSHESIFSDNVPSCQRTSTREYVL